MIGPQPVSPRNLICRRPRRQRLRNNPRSHHIQPAPLTIRKRRPRPIDLSCS